MGIDQYHISIAIIIAVSYLIGSIPTAYIVGKYNDMNIFSIGSGNMGTTNVLRAMGIRWALLVLFLDALKAVVAISIARQIMPDYKISAMSVAAIAAISGHNWSLFATMITGTLRGGKGAATALGAMLMLAPVQVILAMFIVWMLILARTRYMSLGVMSAFFVAAIWLSVMSLQQLLDPIMIPYSVLIAAMIIYRHRENIQRILAGTERRVGERV